MSDPFVVVGGDAAGLSAASKCKREDPDREVIVFEKDTWVSFAHCGMPYYIKGEVESQTDMLSLSPEEIEERGIDLRRQYEVTGVNTEEQYVTYSTRVGKTVRQTYGDLLIATGARASTGPFDGIDLDGAFTLHHMNSAAAIRAYLTDPAENHGIDNEFVDKSLVEKYAEMRPPETVAIVGGGYVGVEMAEAFHVHDLDIHLFQRSEQVLPPFGEAVGAAVGDRLEAKGITLHLGTEVENLSGTGHIDAVVADDGRTPVDCALVGIGIEPNTGVVDGTGVILGESGAIAIDDFGQTSVDRIFAAGDCAEMRHAVTGDYDWVPLGLTANRAGRAIGQTIAGDPEPIGDIAGTAVVKAFELECGRAGILDHERAREAGFDPVSETITAGSRSGYYPGSKETTVHLTADRETGQVLGGSIVGEDRAAIRIDTLSTALEANMTVAELERLDLAYAPPFSPVWDPILVAAKVLRGTLEA
ncbi:FAD-dependent oxidoreductase [Salinibaculum salinum]|uniref:FAD-dependent oxidoreductase n=1 Tax=Salinibaculum salinum TaxID=3131996 RepID=UPI0030EE7751